MTWTPDNPDAPNVVSGPDPYPADETESAEVDLYIERADLGPGAFTLVAAGDPIPAALLGLPRRPRAERGKGKRGKG